MDYEDGSQNSTDQPSWQTSSGSGVLGGQAQRPWVVNRANRTTFAQSLTVYMEMLSMLQGGLIFKGLKTT